ncbi:hypothetical protein RhiirC2_789091 [Rhizophagus irregularis]|uniref:DUF659 domain-containing protein n=1 Tax=Rhizophagus irregularis TaxID=588596 RepID=A0A2N1MNU5_9GLOM|nr:hypothetical protein RhiirC2_789091 [Rhizophagus irregularis]
MSNEKKRKLDGQPQTKCTYCIKYWSHGTSNELEAHLANDCKDVSKYIHSFYLGVVSARNFGNENASPSDTSITHTLLRAFVCCGIPFLVIQNPFFIEFLNKIRLEYEPPTDELLSDRLLSEETSRINKKVDVNIKNSNNLTLNFKALDGWTSPTEKISPKKITALVTDNATNCIKTQEIISSQYPNIINIRYIAHFVNLITKDIIDHDFARQTIKTDKGESLKTYCKTKWTSIYKTTSSVLCLQAALETVLLNNPNDITSK